MAACSTSVTPRSRGQQPKTQPEPCMPRSRLRIKQFTGNGSTATSQCDRTPRASTWPLVSINYPSCRLQELDGRAVVLTARLVLGIPHLASACGTIIGLVAVAAAGSAPGVLSGRRVAGRCASGADIAHGHDRPDTSGPITVCANGPPDSVGDPKQPFMATRVVVVDKMETAVDPCGCVSNSGPIP